ncbi:MULTISPECIES: helix-turn-helix transcriptional regulator [Clostridium]|uniref:Helix-turn-helix transcriptional regulator n=1 Tax=Clostridium senegalense TaxID=1465809 RepID=A0A6M0H2J3_9CLOT|nr:MULTISPECIES: helix-turn-helix transcriptional regulator [Clostridium]NEU04747.1 helix-turn-helix transcriptional regulator [Clostridium senegalense]
MTSEILSIGEKIKRSRIYKGLTLKEICEEKISVSKMSCIENNKVDAEEWILEYISEKLELDINYLKHDVKKQLIDNIEVFRSCKETNNYYDEYFDDIEYNLEYAEKYAYYELCCEIMHLFFSAHIFKRNFDELRKLIPRYYDFCKRAHNELYQLKYYVDVGVYLSLNGEQRQAISYYNSVRTRLKELDVEDKLDLIRTTYNEGSAYMMLSEYEKASEICEELKSMIKYCENKKIEGAIYNLCSLLALHLENYDEFEAYKNKVFKLYKNDYEKYASCLHNFGEVLIRNKKIDLGENCIRESLKIFPRENKEKLCIFLIANLEALIENKMLGLAKEVSNELLTYAINLDSSKFIESAYYYKAILLQLEGDYAASETYMNLSLDALLKCGYKDKIYKRYLQMGNMYHKLGEVSESIKFLNLAMQLEKKI